MLELAFAWLLGHPVVSSVIAGATKPEQVAANAATGGLEADPGRGGGGRQAGGLMSRTIHPLPLEG